MTDAAFYTRAASTAERLLDRFGAPSTLVSEHVAEGAFPGEAGQRTTSLTDCVAAVLPRGNADTGPGASAVLSLTNQTVLIAPIPGQDIQRFSRLVHAGMEWVIVNLTEVAPGGITVLWQGEVKL